MRELARGRYTAAQVDAQIRADTTVIGQRFDLVDRSYQVVDRLDVIGATVDWAWDRTIPRSLTLEMLPRADLLDVPFRYLIKPYFRVKMIDVDGGWAEFPMGAYPFTAPDRTILETGAAGSGSSDTAGDNELAANPETWRVTLGDQMHYLDVATVGPLGFTVGLGTHLTDALAQVLLRNSFSDFSGIAASDATASGALSWSLSRGATRTAFERVFVPGPGPYGTTLALDGRTWYAKYDYRLVTHPLETQTISWATVAAEIHAQLGYAPPGFDLENDRYVARPWPDYARITPDTPTIFYEPADNGLLQPGVQVTPNVGAFGNRATVTAPSTTAGVSTYQVVDLNDYLPGHPLAQTQTGFYMDLEATSPAGSSSLQLLAQGQRLLAEAIMSYESVHITTVHGVLRHDALDIVALRIPGDPIFDVPQYCGEASWSMDLFSGACTHELRRLGIAAEPRKVAITTGSLSVSALTSGGSGTNAASYATASISPTAGRLVLVFVGSGTAGQDVSSITGAGMTWEQVAQSSPGNTLAVFRAQSSSPGSGPLTINFAGTMQRAAWSVFEIVGVANPGDNGASLIVQSTAVASGTGTTSSVSASGRSGGANMLVGSSFHQNDNAVTPDPNSWNEIHDVAAGAEGAGRLETQYLVGDDTTVESSWTGSVAWLAHVLEVQAGVVSG